MTLVAAWVRHNNNTKELYVSSDSRLVVVERGTLVQKS
jgi:hypothetical protein